MPDDLDRQIAEALPQEPDVATEDAVRFTFDKPPYAVATAAIRAHNQCVAATVRRMVDAAVAETIGHAEFQIGYCGNPLSHEHVGASAWAAALKAAKDQS